MERRRRVVVAVLCDAEEEVAVPAGPDVAEVAEVVHAGRVPPVRVRVPVRLEEEESEDGGEPDRSAAPQVDADRRVRSVFDLHIAARGAFLSNPLTNAHGGR